MMEFTFPSTSDGLFDELDDDIRRLTKKNVESNISRRSSVSTSLHGSTSTLNTIEKEAQGAVPLKEGPTLSQFTRLKDFCKAIKASRMKAEEQRVELAANGELQDHFERRELASQMQNLEVITRKKRHQLEDLKRRIANRRIALATVHDEQVLHLEKETALEETVRTEIEHLALRENSLEGRKAHAQLLFKLVVRRRRQMLADLATIYRIEVEREPDLDKYGRPSKPQCSCPRRDVICRCHLPSTVCLLGHNEQVISAALGHVVNVLRSLSWILDYPLRYPVAFGGSNSHVGDPKEDKMYPLFGMRSRVDRDRLDTSICFINRNIGQLRSDCGIASSGYQPATTGNSIISYNDWRYTLPRLAELLTHLTQKSAGFIRRDDRPVNSILSLASVVWPPSEDSEVVEPNLRDVQRCVQALDVLSLADDCTTRDRTMSYIPSSTDDSPDNEIDQSAISASALVVNGFEYPGIDL